MKNLRVLCNFERQVAKRKIAELKQELKDNKSIRTRKKKKLPLADDNAQKMCLTHRPFLVEADFNHLSAAAAQIADIHDISVYDTDTSIQMIPIANVLDAFLEELHPVLQHSNFRSLVSSRNMFNSSLNLCIL